MGVVRQLVKVILLFVLALPAFAGEARADEVTGLIRGVAEEARMISIDVEKLGVVLVRYDKETVFRNIKNVADLKQAESVTVTCTRKGEDRLATVVDRIVHQIPEGATTVTAAQLEELLKQTGETGNVLVIDTRSKVRYPFPSPTWRKEGACSCLPIGARPWYFMATGQAASRA